MAAAATRPHQGQTLSRAPRPGDVPVLTAPTTAARAAGGAGLCRITMDARKCGPYVVVTQGRAGRPLSPVRPGRRRA
jgi:hypothetical protein